LLHFGLLTLLYQARAVDFDERLSERNCNRQGAAGVGDPNPVNQVELFDVLW
jgi:hypothetical protein